MANYPLQTSRNQIDFTAFCKTPPNRNEDYSGEVALAKICGRFKAMHEDGDDEPALFPELADHQADFEQAMKTKMESDGDKFRFPKVFKPSWMFSPVAIFVLWPTDVTWEGDYRIGFPGDADPVKKGVYQLIRDKELLAYCEDGDGEEEVYGISENTLRGWNDLRRRWLEATEKKAFQGKENQDALLKELDDIRRDEQGERPEESGSGPLFKKLQSSEYHCIWRDKPPTPEVHWPDPLWAWVRYQELQEDLEKASQAIRFTPAHATKSPRYFIFPKQNRPKAKAPAKGKAAIGSKTDHLPGMFAFNDEKKLVEINGDEAWLKDRPRFMAVYAGLIRSTDAGLQPTDARILFSAPRLRRDQIRSDNEKSLGSASLLQPMLEALGIAPALPEINFANCPVTLLAEQRERRNELAADESDAEQAKPRRYDLNLVFPVTLEEEKLQKHPFFRHKEKDRWNYQKSGDKGHCFAQFNYSAEEPRYEISLQWPSDIEYAKESAKENSRRKERKHKADWFARMNEFSCLSVDLGQREGGAYALVDARANFDFGKNKKGKAVPSRFIGKTEGNEYLRLFPVSVSFSRREFQNREAGRSASNLRPSVLVSVGANSRIVRRSKPRVSGDFLKEVSVGANSRIVRRARRQVAGSAFSLFQSARIPES